VTFPLSPASPFVAFISVITANFLNGVRVAINEAIDGTGGGAYAPSTRIAITGAGLSADPFAGFIRSGDELGVDTGAKIDVLSGGAIDLESGALLEVKSGALLQIDNGGIQVLVPGAVLTIDAASGPTAAALVHLYGEFHVESGGALRVESGGLIQLISSSGFVALAGSNMLLEGDALVRDGGTFRLGASGAGVGHASIFAGSDLTVLADGSIFVQGTSGHEGLVNFQAHSILQGDALAAMTWASGSVVTLGGTNTINGTLALGAVTTQSGRYDKVGNGAVTGLRVGTPAAWDSDMVFDPTVLDIIEIDVLTADRVWTFSQHTGEDCEVIVRQLDATSQAFDLLIQDDLGVPIGDFPATAGNGSIRYVYGWNGATGTPGRRRTWRVASVRGPADGQSG